MYKQISIKNIKTFEDEQKLKIAPLTLIYGENSSGKTTLLKAFDIVHNIFQQRSVTAGGKTAGINLERGSFEDVKNISARKIHFFSSKINKKPIQIELTLNLPYRNIDSDHPLFSNKITEKYEY
jgi:AAA15 family ATPase/GTPase